jgi:ATP-dependent DNA helicase RecQ
LLRNKRKELADAANVPPYVIFSDKTLAQMAAYFPQSKESLLNMSGMGKVKYERYGTDFLTIIKVYCRENRIEEKYKTPMREKDDAGRRYMVVGDAYNAGESVQNLMARYDVTADTILNHLARYIMAGNPLRSAEDLIALSNLNPDQQMAVFKAFDILGSDMLKPVYDKLNSTVNYDELRILRLCYLCEKR